MRKRWLGEKEKKKCSRQREQHCADRARSTAPATAFSPDLHPSGTPMPEAQGSLHPSPGPPSQAKPFRQISLLLLTFRAQDPDGWAVLVPRAAVFPALCLCPGAGAPQDCPFLSSPLVHILALVLVLGEMEKARCTLSYTQDSTHGAAL